MKRKTVKRKTQCGSDLPTVHMHISIEELHVCAIQEDEELELSKAVYKSLSAGLNQMAVCLMETLVKNGHDVANRHICLSVTFDTLNHPQRQMTTSIQ
jgi:hypothetical protein